MMKSTLRSIVLFLLAVGICMSVSYVGSLYMIPSIPVWYNNLQLPDPTLPSWLFGPVWTVLYVIMGFSLYMIFQAGIKKKEAYLGLIFFITQLVFSFAWVYIFFGLHSIIFGLITAIALWLLLLLTMVQLFRFTVPGGAILIPYFLWVTLIVLLNFFLTTLNPISYNLL